MESVKRVEIVTVAVQRPALLAALEKAGVPGYTVVRHAEGFGDRGRREADELTDVFENVYVLVACPPEVAERVAAAVRPILRRFGGICLVSDASILKPG
jgi:nitrogen regulatory protein PII